MKTEQYLIEARKTSSCSNNHDRLIHASFGVCSEIGELLDCLKRNLFYGVELDMANIIEELGDIYWYIAEATNGAWCSFQEANVCLFQKKGDELVSMLTRTLTKVLCIASEIFNVANSTMDSRSKMRHTTVLFQDLIYFLDTAVNGLGLERADVLESNIRKLRARYSDKFNKEECLNRDTKKELEQMKVTARVGSDASVP